MAISARMLAVIQKVDAAREARFARMRAKNKDEGEQKRLKQAARERKKPPSPRPPTHVWSTGG
jgi:hypothetical protein